jgi:DNA-binding NtrC family response regulator
MKSLVSIRPDERTPVNPVEPALFLCLTAGGKARRQHRRIPREGLLLGRDELVYDRLFRDPRMAARHARVDVDDDGHLTVRDLGSAHGTWVNGERVAGERPLRLGDVLRLGDTLFVCATRSESDPGPETELVGGGSAMAAIRRSVEVVATRKHAVVITGDTGTGKEVVARLIHQRSGRTGPFIAVNCSTFTDALLASELFGHARGAFTGAVSEHLGLFRAAHGGTLLLDEMADMPLPVQACLLRVLETRTVRPIGSTKDIEVDVRVVATSNRELVDLVRAGQFRADLYARLAQWTIRTPSLRERREDIPELVSHLLPRVDGAGRELSADLWEAVLLHEWPLNVRGLMNVLSIAVLSADDDTAPLTATAEVREAMWQTRSMALSTGLGAEPRVREPAEPVWVPRRNLDKSELERLMVEFQGQVAAAARHIGMTRPKLYRMLGAYGLEPRSYRCSFGPGATDDEAEAHA